MTPEEALREVEEAERKASAEYRQACVDADEAFEKEAAAANTMDERSAAVARMHQRKNEASAVFGSTIGAAWQRCRKALGIEKTTPAE